MTEPTQTVESQDMLDELAYGELSTAHLTGGSLELDPQLPRLVEAENGEQVTDWLALLTARPLFTQPLDDELPLVQTWPTGMVEHSMAPRIKPTLWARLTTGLRRGALLAVLAVLAVGALAAGSYTLFSTSWLSTLTTPTSPTIQDTTTRPDAGAQPQNQEQEPGLPLSSRPPLTGGATAQELRDQGMDQYRAGNYGQALGLLESAVEAGGGDALAYHQLGLAYMASAEREHAIEDAELAFRTAVSLQPDWAAPHQLLAESLLRRGFYQEAIAPASESVKLNPEQAGAWVTLGRAYAGAGERDKAEQAFSEAARHSPPSLP